MTATALPPGLGGPRPVSAGRTDPGRVRDHNEDDAFRDDARGVWAVADGMGGHEAGDVASAEIVRHLDHVRAGWADPRALALDVVSRLEDADAALRRYAAERALGPVGATVVCLVAFGGHGLALWCGDSRLYRLRDGAGLERMTRDHTFVQDLIDRGLLTEEEAESHPQSHVLTRAVGAAEALSLEDRTFALRPGDRCLLCSDGLTRVVPEAEIAAVAADRALPPQEVCDRLVARTLALGAPDNVTVLVVDFD